MVKSGPDTFHARPVYAGYDHDEAGLVPFRLTHAQAAFLFKPGQEYGGCRSPYADATTLAAAEHIRDFVRKYRDPNGVPVSYYSDEDLKILRRYDRCAGT
jgi:hypothetical protein